MSLKRTVQFWRIGFIAISIMMLLSVSGCSDTHLEDEQVVESEIAVQVQQQNVKDNEDEIIEICSQLYKKLQRRIRNGSYYCKSVWRKWVSGC